LFPEWFNHTMGSDSSKFFAVAGLGLFQVVFGVSCQHIAFSFSTLCWASDLSTAALRASLTFSAALPVAWASLPGVRGF
jgi:hypothetical protein